MDKVDREKIVKLIERICDNYCVYRCTSDEEGSCQYMKEHSGECFLDELVEMAENE